jgi:16S rRNA G527 N7-methylase RsmG
MVESKMRKAAFLREVARELSLTDVSVEAARFESLSNRDELRGAIDLVTVRAVRIDEAMVSLLDFVLSPDGEAALVGFGRGEFAGFVAKKGAPHVWVRAPRN